MLHLTSITEADLPRINGLWYEAFAPSGFLALIPDTPGVRQWWIDANSHDLRHKPAAHYWKVVDDENPDGPIVAYAKWDLQSAEERGERFPPWHPDMDQKACDEIFGKMEGQRRALVGGQKNYYLDMLCTHPHYRGRGAASLLMAWGCEQADRDQMPLYVDATPEGKPLYERFGFEDRTIPETVAKGVRSMVREPKSS